MVCLVGAGPAATARNAVQIMSAERAVKESPAPSAATVPVATVVAVATARVGIPVLALGITSAELAEVVVMIVASMATATALVTRVSAASIARVMR